MPSASCGLSALNSCTKASKVLLLQAVRAWRSGCLLLEGKVHALVPAVLLRMAGLDALDGNAEAKPPDRELGEVEQGIGASKGDAVVGADGQRQAAFAKQPFEGRAGEVFAGRLEGFTQE